MRIFLAILLILPLKVWAIDFVSIGDPANPCASNGKGRVAYKFEISKYEITNAEYCSFLNCVASQEDTYKLFSPLMQEHFFGGIIRVEHSKERVYTYICKTGYEKLPVVGLTWMSAIRYINWLHYNAANIANGIALDHYIKQTEGDDTHGAYDTRSVPSKRNSNALYWLPKEDEWVKAAFYDGNKWNEGLVAKGSNCYTVKGWAYPYPHIKEVGKFVIPSHYGTYDQQGNAAEWIEDSQNGDHNWKLALGGSLIRPASFALFGEKEGDFPTKSITTFGLRVCRSSDNAKLKKAKPDIFIPIETKENSLTYHKDKLGNDYVLVGDAGNTGDIINQFKGRVNYEFFIARTELSNNAYCRFLNAVATFNDPYGLYDENMATGACGGILRTKKNGKFYYYLKDGWGNRPVVYVNYYDIARFANWMHYGCPNTGKCEVGTTEGTTSQGAYDTSNFEDVRKGKKPPYKEFGKRNKGARFWIPSDDEWYKAAYYAPSKTGNRKYHDYPTQTSDAPNPDQANYMYDEHIATCAPFYLAPIDSFLNAPSYYGTLQQGGNVWEWTEDWQYGQVGCRGLRGGSWSYTYYGLNAVNMDPGGIDNFSYVFGARICMATSEEGWQPVETPLFTKAYEFVLLMPKNHLLLFIAFTLLLSIIGCFSLIWGTYRIIRKYRNS